MTKKDIYHVKPNTGPGWQVLKRTSDGQDIPAGHCTTRSGARALAKGLNQTKEPEAEGEK